MGIRMSDENVTWLGHLVWYSLAGDTPVSLDQLLTWSQELDLPLVSQPTPRTADAFKTATTEVADDYEIAPGITAYLDFKHIRATEEVVVRHLSKMVVDSRASSTRHEKLAEVKFHRPTRTHAGRRPGSEQITYRLAPDLSDTDRGRAEALLERVMELYRKRCDFLAEGTLRKQVRDLIDVRMQALPLRRSGLYFVLPEHLPTLQATEQLVKRMGPGCTLHYLPLVDDAKQRQLLSDALAAECMQVAEGIMELAQHGLAGRVRAQQAEVLERQTLKADELDRRYGVASEASRAALGEATQALLTLSVHPGAAGR